MTVLRSRPAELVVPGAAAARTAMVEGIAAMTLVVGVWQVLLSRWSRSPHGEVELTPPQGGPARLAFAVDEREPFIALAHRLQRGMPAGADAWERMTLHVEEHDLAVTVETRAGGRLGQRLDARAELAVDRLAEHYGRLFDGLLADPGAPIRAVASVPEQELRAVAAWSSPWCTDTPATDPLRRFDAEVAAHPGRAAVIDGGRTVTFAELDVDVRRMAGALESHGVGRGSRVGVCVSRSARLLGTILAVWRRGAAYVPMDPSYPPARRAAIIADAGLAAVVTDLAPEAWPAGVTLVAPDASTGAAGATGPATGPQDAAYLMYTSGSTGRPKGVLVSRGNVAHLMRGLELSGVYPDAPAVVGWNASVSFDASVQQWVRVCRGDTVAILEEGVRTDAAALARWVRDAGVTDLDATPSHWEAVADAVAGGPPGAPLRLYLGGEAISAHLWSRLAGLADRGWVRTANLYGPTECTVDATAAEVHGERPHIGGPLPGVRAYVLDRWLRQAGIGVPGELYLAGGGVAHGYTGNPGLTAGRFVADPHVADGGRMYGTGDLVQWCDDGTLLYLGRLDRQVKIRGHRVEPGDVEAALRDVPGVAAVVVAVVAHPSAPPALVAYYVAGPGAPDPGDRLREHASIGLPAYMVPADIVRVAAVPRTTSGKVDLAALARSVPSGRADAHPAGTPTGPVETLIAAMWGDLLGRTDISADDDFFELGGHSLFALKLAARLRKRLDVAVTTRDVYRRPRLRDLAGHVARLADGGGGAEGRAHRGGA
jgi:amino acid adenylation domain-containing protein